MKRNNVNKIFLYFNFLKCLLLWVKDGVLPYSTRIVSPHVKVSLKLICSDTVCETVQVRGNWKNRKRELVPNYASEIQVGLVSLGLINWTEKLTNAEKCVTQALLNGGGI